MDGTPASTGQLCVVKVGHGREPLEPRLGIVLASSEQGAAGGIVVDVLAVDGVGDDDHLLALGGGAIGILAEDPKHSQSAMERGAYGVDQVGEKRPKERE
jgi:hypothetical protein